LKDIDTYKELVKLVNTKVGQAEGHVFLIIDESQARAQEYTTETLLLTSKLLAKNPEFYTIWNVRRRLLIHGLFANLSATSSHSTESPSSSHPTQITPTSSEPSSSSAHTSSTDSTSIPQSPGNPSSSEDETTLNIIQDDLDFTVPLLLKYPKCYWIWNYRLWLLQQGKKRLPVGTARKLWQMELGLAAKMLSRDSRNFHGWGYRKMIVAELESAELQGASMVESEFEYTTKMINANLSNFSAWHSRGKLIPRLLNERRASDAERRKFLDSGKVLYVQTPIQGLMVPRIRTYDRSSLYGSG
jgi:geranylgeranyl transferase type-2 subunit alpha